MNQEMLAPEIDEGADISLALEEYIESMDDGEAAVFRIRLASDGFLRNNVYKAINEMAMFMAAVHVMDDDAEFEVVAGGVFGGAASDSPDIQRLRNYYLENADRIAINVFGVPDETVVKRIEIHLAAYQMAVV